jgi:hypothetical protein
MILNIIEPTLNSYAGHCYSLVEAIAQAAPVEHVRIWAGKKSENFWQGKGQIKPYFSQTFRRLQSYFLFRRLLREPGKLLLSTAGSTDLVLLNWAASGPIPRDKVYLYVHWMGAKASKSALLAKVAKKQPNLEILCTTASTTAFFSELGFRSRTVPYPRLASHLEIKELQTFKHLLFAGAARLDKGFNRIADFVEYLAQINARWPISVQASTTHQAKHGSEILLHIDRLMQSGYSQLTLIRETLAPQAYQALFSGGISIQPYSESDFEDRVSGVTLDALCAGCPVVVTANTWLGRIVLKYHAGVVTSDLSPKGLTKAVEDIMSDYPGYSQRAEMAGRVLRQEHSEAALMKAIFCCERSSKP